MARSSGLNTWFQHHPRRLWTRKSPDGKTRNQIDYITVNQRFRNCIVHAKCYPGADCNSDHVLVVSYIRVKLKKAIPRKRVKPRLKIRLLWEDKNVREKFQQETVSKLITLPDGVDEKFEVLCQTLTDAAEKVIHKQTGEKKQKWMTDEILLLMEDRRLFKQDTR